MIIMISFNQIHIVELKHICSNDWERKMPIMGVVD